MKNVILVDKSSTKVTLPKNYASADASRRTTAITIVGNALNNTIIGGTGNNTLYGSVDNDLFTYTSPIRRAMTLSRITRQISTEYPSQAAIMPNGLATLRALKSNAAGKKVIINGVTRIFEDGVMYSADKKKSTFTGGSADDYWFDEHDLEQGGQLDLLIESTLNYSLGKLDTSKNDNLTRLTKDEFILTYGDKK